ncbi:MAG: HDOD domain-containing protein [Rhodocyclaceae bacterium]
MTTTSSADLTQTTLDKVPPIAGTVMELLRSLDDENLNATNLAKKIGHDPVLSARVLKIVNSPFYGVAGQVASLQEAVMVLGFSNVRRLALAVSLNGSFPVRGQGEADPRRIWRHSFCVALCAQALAPLCRIEAESAFTAGLLHDIGRIALLSVDPQRFAAVLAGRAQYPDLAAAEAALLGFTHAEFGARLLERWRLPGSLIRAVEFHHQPDTAPTHPLTDLIYVADQLAHAIADNTLESAVTMAAPNGAAIRLGLTRVQAVEALAPVPDRIEALAAVLN